MQLGLSSQPQQRFARAVQRRQALRSPAAHASVSVSAKRQLQRAVRLRATGGEGAEAVPGASRGRPPSTAGSPDAVIKTARQVQLSASELLARRLFMLVP